MSRTEYLFKRMENILKEYKGSCINKGLKEQQDLWHEVFEGPYETLMQELERL